MINETKSTVHTAVQEWLTVNGFIWHITLIGDACPLFCPDKGKPGIGLFPRKSHIHGQHYRLELKRKRGERLHFVAVDFWNSYADVELLVLGTKDYQNHKTFRKYGTRGKPFVHVADVLGCVQFYDPGSLDNFCSDFGYDIDSQKARAIYDAVCEQAREIRPLFSTEELDTLTELMSEL